MDEECKHLKTIVDSTHVLLALLDKNFNFLRVNKAYAEADNKDISYFPGKNHFELYPNEENEQIFRNVIESGEPFYIRGKPFEYPMNPERGETYWDWSLVPIKDSDGEVNSLVFTLRDVTDREITRQKLKKSNRKNVFYKDLLAHDMRNILYVIQSSTELMEHWDDKTLSSEEVQEMMGEIKKQVEKAADLISNVQKLSKVEREDRKFRTIDLKELLGQLVPEIQKRFSDKNIIINEQYPSTPCYLEAGDLLIDAFENILINAIVHNDRKQKKIWIKISKTELGTNQYFKIEIKDNGNGIPNEDKEKVFRQGFKRDHSSGMGIGLSLVKEIIEGYNGRVWVENRIKGDYTRGSNFILLLKAS